MVGQVLSGLAFMVIAGVIVVTNLRLKRRGHRTTGTVAGLERDWNPDPDTPGYTYCRCWSSRPIAGRTCGRRLVLVREILGYSFWP